MGKTGILALFFAYSLSLFAQHVLPTSYDTMYSSGKYRHEIILSGIADYYSTSLNNELTSKLLFGGQITDGIKNRTFGQHGAINRFGADISGELEYRNYKIKWSEKDRIGFAVKGGYYAYSSLLYGKDVFGLTFYGNEKYVGQTADFSGTRFLGMTFQKVGIGFFNKQSKNAVFLNYYSISNYLDGTVYSGQLYQSDQVDSVRLRLNGEVDYATSRALINGWGAGVDLDFRFPVKLNEKKTAIIRFEAKNLGICMTNKPLVSYRTDTTVNFSGYTLNQLFSDEASGGKKLSIIDSLGIDSSGVSKWRFLPAYFQVGKIVSENDSSMFQSFFGVRMYNLPGYFPMIFAGLHYKLARFADLGLQTSFGGFGKLRFGMYSNWRIGNCTLGIGTENLAGLILKSAKGQSLSIRLRCLI